MIFKRIIHSIIQSTFLSTLLFVSLLCAAIILSIFPISSSAAYNPNTPLDRTKLTPDQRKFLNAYEAIKANDRPLIAVYKKELQNYILYPYLSYLDFRYHFKSTPESQIAQFIRSYPDHTLTPFLIKHYLEYLGSTHQSRRYLKYFNIRKQSSTELQCYYFDARIRLGQTDAILDKGAQFWESQESLPRACRLLNKTLHSKKRITGSMVWQRIELNMRKGHLKQAKRLSRELSPQGRKTLNFWVKTYRKPQLINRKMPSYVPAVIRKPIFKQGVRRISYSNPKLALSTLKLRADQYGLNHLEKQKLSRQISLRFAYKYLPEAQDYLKNLDQAVQSEKVMNWRLQLAIRESNWVNYLDLYDLLPNDMQQQNRWLYWKARSYEALNEFKQAKPIYQNLAKERNFYGFMSADKLHQPYQFNPAPDKSFNMDKLIKKYPQLSAIKELIAIHWSLSLRRAWYHLLKRIEPDDIEAVANYMSEGQQHHLAIQTIAKAKMWDDLDLRFPTPYKKPVLNAAKKHTIDPAWVYGVMRRESAFSPTISSHAGAVGLMQILPNTARYIGRKLGFKRKQYTQLTNAESNIQLGSAYLNYLDDKYDGNRILATAAYNAGPDRVDTWIPKNSKMSADQWIDTIPFTETRDYVKAVMEYTTIFKSVLSKHYDRLENFMKPIGGDTKVVASK
ncbi:transglycosylase SLT domain-containing protein [Hydrogenovibrio kuenenii]|uniref:transglycosylase SLT domain-containing protein n=1 Tax=Hydrogenovibrio kuenenii TaxID=63658 RepID=UPI0004679774|nr:transglycosylase SLT domain-containing protein [Hydrogenovibrio kuenenii]